MVLLILWLMVNKIQQGIRIRNHLLDLDQQEIQKGLALIHLHNKHSQHFNFIKSLKQGQLSFIYNMFQIFIFFILLLWKNLNNLIIHKSMVVNFLIFFHIFKLLKIIILLEFLIRQDIHSQIYIMAKVLSLMVVNNLIINITKELILQDHLHRMLYYYVKFNNVLLGMAQDLLNLFIHNKNHLGNRNSLFSFYLKFNFCKFLYHIFEYLY